MLGPSALAKALGISRQMVYQYERDGKITRGAGGFDLEAVRAQLAHNLGEKRGGSPKRGNPATPEPAVSRDASQVRPGIVLEAEPQPHGGWLRREHAIEDLDAPEGSKADLEKQLLAERVEQKRRDNEKESGKLIDADEAEKAWGDMVTTSRNKALMLPSELAPKLALEADPVVCEEILRAGIYSMLSELANYQPPANG
jgi:hypothetical protein